VQFVGRLGKAACTGNGEKRLDMLDRIFHFYFARAFCFFECAVPNIPIYKA
jgi:hypothetical protein